MMDVGLPSPVFLSCLRTGERTRGANSWLIWFKTKNYCKLKARRSWKNTLFRNVRKASLPDILVWHLELRWPTPGIKPVGPLHSWIVLNCIVCDNGFHTHTHTHAHTHTQRRQNETVKGFMCFHLLDMPSDQDPNIVHGSHDLEITSVMAVCRFWKKVVVAAAFTGFLHCQSHDAGNTQLCSDYFQSVMFLCLAKMQPKQLFHTNWILGSVGHEITFVPQYTIQSKYFKWGWGFDFLGSDWKCSAENLAKCVLHAGSVSTQ